MPRAYFDVLIYDHIVKGYIPVADVDALRPLIARRKVMVCLSPTNVDTSTSWSDSGATTRRRPSSG